MSTRTRRRRRQRGAALVEAAVVMPVLVIFLGLLEFVYAEYATKQQLMAQSRYDAFTKSLHADCDGIGDIGNGLPVIGSLESAAKYVPGVGQLLEGVQALATTENPDVVGVAIGGGRSRVEGSTSYVYCSPQSFSEVWQSMVTKTLDSLKHLISKG